MLRLYLKNAVLLAAVAAAVTSIATRFGVWELGQFAGEYRQHFGELPSETLGGKLRCG
jgi:AraC family ethanolamine operon transcriptional activator